MKRVLSGMQPSGKPHLGNYLGAMRQHIAMQEKYECFYFIANYHALTTVRDPEKMREMSLNLAIDYLALGLDPKKTIFFQQSDVPEVTELTWILDCITNMGLLERAHAWKDATEKGKKEKTVGLFNYPVLMAADILIYQSDIVPVGKDQKQHVEIARDIAGNFNNIFGETFKLPEPVIEDAVATVPGTDGEKMSKSYGNTIDIFAEEKELKKQVMGIITDSTPLEKPKDTKTCTVFKLYSQVASESEIKGLEDKYKSGGFGYGDAKKLLYERLLEHLSPFRQKRIDLEKKKDYVKEVLFEGGKRASSEAKKTLDIVRKKIGIN